MIAKKNTAVKIFFFTLLISGIAAPLFGSDNSTAKKAAGSSPVFQEIFSTTNHTLRLGKKNLHYTATAGYLVIKEDDGKQKANIFFVAYTKKGPQSRRPVTFAFNGGPGSSSVWLHFGAIGPKRVQFNNAPSAPPPPAVLIDNEFTWLAFTDVVFIDPVGTGYSRALDKKEEKKFYNVKKDIESVGEFIRRYISRYDRWLSPKFIAGESYGTIRAAGLTENLLSQHGIDLNGVLLISPVLDFNTIMFNPTNDLPYLLFLPTYAATSWYHKHLSGKYDSMKVLLGEAEDWVLSEYSVGLMKGNSLSEEKRDALAEAASLYTGLSRDYILNSSLKIRSSRFRKELLRKERQVVGRMDSRFTGPDADAAGASPAYDPSLEPFIGTFSSAVNHYIKKDLKFESDLPYLYLNNKVNRTWDWGSALHHGQGYVNVSQTLTEPMNINRYLR